MKAIKDIPRPFFEIYYFCAVTAFAIIYSFPLIISLSGIFYGFPWDSLGGIWNLWWLRFSYLNNISFHIHTYLSYSSGYNLSNNPYPYLFNFIGFLLTYFTNEVAAFNIIKLISFPILAITAYFLIFYVTGIRTISAIVGLVYAFSPFHIIHNMAHFANLYWLPLAILFLLKLLREGGYRNAILFGLFWGFTFIDNAYYAYFLGLFVPVFISASILNEEVRGNLIRIVFLKNLLISFLVFLFIVFPMMYPMIKGIFFPQGSQIVSAYGGNRAFSDLFVFSAKPLDYLIPSKYNPFLGWLIPDFGMSPLKGHRYTEHTLYLGYSLILLGGHAFYCALRKKGQLAVNSKDRQTIYLFFAIAIVAAILSAPPFIPLGKYHIDIQTREIFAEHKLYLPQYFLYKLFPMFRVYARMGAVVLLAVCVLAAFGLREISARINTLRMRYFFLFLFSLIIFIEYAEFPSFRLTMVKEPEVYKWLASQSGQFPIVEYPLGASDDPYTTYEYAFYQRIHKKYLVNGAAAGTPADKFRKEVMDISKEEAVDKLSDIGVKYIIIHKDKYTKGNEYVPLDWLTQPPRDKLFPVEYNDGKIPNIPIKRLRLIKDFGDVAVYEPIQGS
jgi:hypothetical protein